MTSKTPLQLSLERAAARQAPSIGQWLEFPGYHLARTVAALGEDWVLIDTEHGAIPDAEMALSIAAVAAAGVSPIVRIASSDPWMMKRALDAGAHGIMVPMCETAEQARAIVAGCRYPPLGVRGAGAMFAHSAFNTNPRDYLLHANERVTVIVQIESRKAIENIEEIASVEGVDMLFIGPNDLASSMGYVAFEHPHITEVQEAIETVRRVGKEKGKYVGHFALSAEEASKRWKQGFDFVNCGADIVALTAWMGGEMGRLKEMVQDES
ncbi:HpcH/HpaI aldolase family protein [Aspergillus stella-maris]|uniref:HpcH/HpaI aldolase family protein n=1 Tax=Aspergillus stella-maris TaxID=1810926 RepID=UPI003CCDEBB8